MIHTSTASHSPPRETPTPRQALDGTCAEWRSHSPLTLVFRRVVLVVCSAKEAVLKDYNSLTMGQLAVSQRFKITAWVTVYGIVWSIRDDAGLVGLRYGRSVDRCYVILHLI